MTESKVNLAKAIIAVMKEVKGMEKNSRIGKGQSAYDGTKDQDVKIVFNEALAKHGLCILPIDIREEVQIDRWDAKDYNGKPTQKQSAFTIVVTKYLLLHESGESQELTGYGHGVDPQDKGAGKATTYALKNCLLLTFLTPVGKMPDTDNDHSHDLPQPQKKAEPKKERVPRPLLKPEQYKAMLKKLSNGEYLVVEQRMKTYDLSLEQLDNLENAIKECKELANG